MEKTTTTHRTFNKNLQSEIKTMFPTATNINKRHIAGVGYVYFIKNNQTTLGKTFKDGQFMVVFNDQK